MAVNLLPPDPASLLPVAGVDLGFAYAGIRKVKRHDLMLMRLAPGSKVAGVFTQNAFAAAPVQVCRQHLGASETMRALGCRAAEVLPFSTGVILEDLPVDRIEAALPGCVSTLAPAHWAEAAAAIMTTDTVPKAASRTLQMAGVPVTVTGMAKGVGMLQPNMATMLAFIATDASISGALLRRMVREVADASFNRVTVDGDTSTNDSFVLISTGAAAAPEVVVPQDAGYAALKEAVKQVAVALAQSIARDGEGATKFITIKVNGAKSEEEAVRVAKAVAHSPLVKTAFFASDPNLGRLIMAIGNAGVAGLDTSRIDLYLGDVKVIERGGRAEAYREEDGAR